MIVSVFAQFTIVAILCSHYRELPQIEITHSRQALRQHHVIAVHRLLAGARQDLLDGL